jgi:hypothetical protein
MARTAGNASGSPLRRGKDRVNQNRASHRESSRKLSTNIGIPENEGPCMQKERKDIRKAKKESQEGKNKRKEIGGERRGKNRKPQRVETSTCGL